MAELQTLRPYQQNALNELRLGIRAKHKAQVLMMATGSGKTSVASHIMAGASSKGKRAFFIVDSVELVDQAYERFTTDGMDVGIIQGINDLTDYSCPVQVATIQTLKNRWDRMPDWMKPDVIVIDECHINFAAHRKVMAWAADEGRPVIGLSATPFRKGLAKHFDKLVVGATTDFLTKEGYLVPARYYAPYTPDLKGVKTKANGDWQEDALGDAMSDKKLVADIVETWLKMGENRQTIVFAANVGHSRLLCDQFQRAGIAAEHIDGYERDPEVRKDKIDAFRRGEIKILCNCAVLTKGFDAPETGCIVLARPTKSLMLHIQMIGRGLRLAEGKRDCIVLDHAGNIRNGLPTDSLPETLDDGTSKENPDRKKQDKKDPIAKPCISCGHISTKHKCPACGFAPEKRTDVEIIEGELYEVQTGEKGKKWTSPELHDLYAELKHYAMQKGHHIGWAWHKCREFAGSAPRNTRQIPPKPPSPGTLNVIKHMNIKNAKARASKQNQKPMSRDQVKKLLDLLDGAEA